MRERLRRDARAMSARLTDADLEARVAAPLPRRRGDARRSREQSVFAEAARAAAHGRAEAKQMRTSRRSRSRARSR